MDLSKKTDKKIILVKKTDAPKNIRPDSYLTKQLKKQQKKQGANATSSLMSELFGIVLFFALTAAGLWFIYHIGHTRDQSDYDLHSDQNSSMMMVQVRPIPSPYVQSPNHHNDVVRKNILAQKLMKQSLSEYKKGNYSSAMKMVNLAMQVDPSCAFFGSIDKVNRYKNQIRIKALSSDVDKTSHSLSNAR